MPGIAGLVTAASAAAFAALVGLLHVLRRDLAPGQHFISEYAIGRGGWVMRLAFGCLTLACASCAVAVATPWAAVLFALCAFGAAGAGAFVTDPPGTPSRPWSPGALHLVFSALVIPAFPAAAIVAAAAGAASPVGRAGAALAWLAAASMAGFAAFATWPWLRFRPGLAQRTMVAAYCAFLLVAGLTATRPA